MEGGGPPTGRAALASHIEHPTRATIVEAVRWIGPLSAPDLKTVFDAPGFPLAQLTYHLRALTSEGVLMEMGGRPAGASIEALYYFPVGR
ncbi:MAG TPA: hypothetical protein VEW07_13075 [Solirubrobacterales bacterium]|nr:hypothetical protein [Solirubrobacterales bacterium]